MDVFFIEHDDLLQTYNSIWKFGIESAIVLKKNLIVNPSTIKNF